MSSPRWSPNGEQLAFISKASSAKDTQNQIFVLPMKGGQAKQISVVPMLILANIGDTSIPVMQSYKLYHTLIDNGTVTKFIGWPIPAHNATDPLSQRERDRYWLN